LNILNNIKKFPGGLLIIPMIIAILINSISSNLLNLGDPSTSIFTNKSTMCFIGIMLVITGSQFELSYLKLALKRGGILVLSKLTISIIFGILIVHLSGLNGVWGISSLALVTCISSCNPGVYIALLDNYGDEIDLATFGMLNLIAVPTIPICILNFANGNGIDLSTILATVLPFALGLILGNVDSDIRKMLQPGTSIIMPFLGFSLGSSINIFNAINAGISGFLLLIIFFIVNTIPMVTIDKVLLKQPGYSASAICCVAGISIAVPQLAAQTNSIYLPYVNTSLCQIAFTVLLSTFTTPFLTSLFAKKQVELV
jgi:2-keto-3-deoxygluconate permease